MKCCQIDCPVTAEYRIEWDQVANPDNYTEACEGHVGALLGHHPHQPAPEHYRVYPIGSSLEEPTRRIPPREFDIESHTGLYAEPTTNQDGQQTPAPSGHAGLGTTGQSPSAVRSSEEDFEPDLACESYIEDPHSRFCDTCGYPEREREHKRTGSREKASCIACEGKPVFPNIPCSLCGRYPDGSSL